MGREKRGTVEGSQGVARRRTAVEGRAAGAAPCLFTADRDLDSDNGVAWTVTVTWE